jgi:hypothetical protein
MQPVRVYRILLGLHRCQRYDIAVVDERGMTLVLVLGLGTRRRKDEWPWW